jgi:hypothetical protein
MGSGFPVDDRAALVDGLDEAWGPKMLALTELQRRYVLAMLADPLGSASGWAKRAGYATGGRAHANAAHKNRYGANADAIMEAAREEAGRHLTTVGPVLAVGVLMMIARDKNHRRQFDAALALADRSGFHMRTEHKVTVEHVADERMLELARRWAQELGVEEIKLVGSNHVADGALDGPGGGEVAGAAGEDVLQPRADRADGKRVRAKNGSARGRVGEETSAR